MDFDANQHQHIRFNPLRNEWILVSPHRMLRPWNGQTETHTNDEIPPYDPTNPLCPGVVRTSGLVTPQYESTCVFSNDFPALLEDGPDPPVSDDPLFQAAPARGICRVMCFHPKSNVYLPTMSTKEVQNIVEEWMRQTQELGKKYEWVQIFENRGAIMGCSNPHPHCQIWASSFLPSEIRIKDECLRSYFENYGRPLLSDYTRKELIQRERLVVENTEWLVVVPYWAVWPFETMVLPKRQIQRFTEVDENQKNALALILQALVTKYDNLFKCSFPYSMGWHGAPTGTLFSKSQPHWTFHGCYYPPLLRSATIKKFMVGYEMLAQCQRDITAEEAAAKLREQSDLHFSINL